MEVLMYGFVYAVCSVVLSVVLVFLFHLVRAPFLQRDEARAEVMRLQRRLDVLNAPPRDGGR